MSLLVKCLRVSQGLCKALLSRHRCKGLTCIVDFLTDLSNSIDM